MTSRKKCTFYQQFKDNYLRLQLFKIMVNRFIELKQDVRRKHKQAHHTTFIKVTIIKILPIKLSMNRQNV